MVKTAASHAVNIGSNPVWVTSSLLVIQFYILRKRNIAPVLRFVASARKRCAGLLRGEGKRVNLIVGIDCRVGPPVPIPNTEVKHTYADDTWRVTARENK